jgi:two-component system, cell cycle response regulator DivK
MAHLKAGKMALEANVNCRLDGQRVKKVLIVEDNVLNMKLFNDVLEAQGYQTLQTDDGVEALKIARDHRPDLILMDIQLPHVSGLEVIRWLKEDDELRSIPIIAITAFAMKGDEQKIRSSGCEAYIAKPISVGIFLRTVAEFLSDAPVIASLEGLH